MYMKFRGYSGIKTALALAAALAAFAVNAAAAADKCGLVEKLTRTVMVQREGGEVELQEGDAVFTGDKFRVGQMGYAEIKLIDDTRVAMGANSVVTLPEVQFNVRKSSLNISIDYGAVWVSTGSIGLVNAAAVKFTTPNAIVSSGNATLQFKIGNGTEELKVQWIPNGGRVSVYNVKSKQRAELRKPDTTFSLTGLAEVEEKTEEDEEGEEEEGEVKEEEEE
jgi:hypothetical protein